MPPAPRDWASVRAELALTRAARRRARDRRLADYADFGHRHGWPVVGLHQDLSQRYPLDPLLGAFSAQAEMALSGPWEREPALVASVLVRRTLEERGDVLAQLTTLDTGPVRLQYTAVWHRSGPDVVMLGESQQPRAARVADLLRAAPAGSLRPGDHVAAGDAELVHLRLLRRGTTSVDIEGPLRLLAFLARDPAAT